MSVYDYVRELETPTPAKSMPRGRRWREYNVRFGTKNNYLVIRYIILTCRRHDLEYTRSCCRF